MALTVEATVDGGALRLSEPLPGLRDGERVWVTLHIASERDVVQTSYGVIGWTGDSETVRRVTLDPEFSVLEGP